MVWFRVVVLIAVLSVVVRCEVDRRDVHRIVLKPERSKKSHKKHHHPSKHHHKPHHHHRELDYEPQAHASSFHSEETPYYYDSPVHKPHHRYHNHHEEYHELTKPRPPSRENNYFSYPEEEKFPSKHFRNDIKDIWNPMSTQNKPVSRKPPPSSYDFPSSNKNPPRRKSTIKPSSLSELIDITTDKPRKYPLPILSSNQFEHSMTIAKKPNMHITPESLIPKDFGPSEHSYEVHEDFVEPRTPPTNFGGISPMMGNYLSNSKTPQPFLPTTVPFITANIYRSNGDYGLRTRQQNVQGSF